MSITDRYLDHDLFVHIVIANVNGKIMKQLLKHIMQTGNYASHATRKRTGLFAAIESAPAATNSDLRVAYCTSGKTVYLNSQAFYNDRDEYYALLDDAYSGRDTVNAYKSPYELLQNKINTAVKA